MSRFDKIYRRFIVLNKFFKQGWGKPDDLRRLFEFRKIISNRETCYKLVPPDYPIILDKETDKGDHVVLAGHFKSPFVEHLPGIMPPEVQQARFEVILPKKWKGHLKPLCVHLAGTGDHGFLLRYQTMAVPLLREHGIASILLENPFYGYRKPKAQMRSSLLHVSDLFVMGGALVVESLALLHWCERQKLGPLGLTGISMGGHMAAASCTVWPGPLSVVPCLSWTTASCILTHGVFSNCIPWKVMEQQYASDTVYRDQLANMAYSPEDHREEVLARLQENYGSVVAPDTRPDIAEVASTPVISCDTGLHASPAGSTEQRAHLHTTTALSRHSQNKGATDGASNRKRLKSRRERNENDHQQHGLHSTVVDFMRLIMDECTHLGNFSVPYDPELIIILEAKHDAYVPRDRVLPLNKLWPGSEVRYINAGHIYSCVRERNRFRLAIKEAFDRHIKKYYNSES